MPISILPAILVISPEPHHEDDFLSVVFRSVHTRGPTSHGNWYRNSQGKKATFKDQHDDIRVAGTSGSYVAFLIKKWMKLFDQKDIKSKLCLHDIDRILKATDEQVMEKWLHELSAIHQIPEEKIKEHITKACYPIEKFLQNGEEVKLARFQNLCTSVAESSWFARCLWSFEYVVQGKIVKGKGKPRAKPYTKEENRENWKFTKDNEQYEKHFGHKPGFIMAPGVPHRIRPEGSTWPEPLEND